MDPSAAQWMSDFSHSQSEIGQPSDNTQDLLPSSSKKDISKIACLRQSVCLPIFFDVSLQQSQSRRLGIARSTSWPLIQYPSTQDSWLADDLISIPKYNYQLDNQIQQISTHPEQTFVPSIDTLSFLFNLQSSSSNFQEQIQFNMEHMSKRDLRLKCSKLEIQARQRKQQLSSEQHSQQRNGFDMIINVDFYKDVEILSIIENENMSYEAYWENEYVKIRMLNREFQIQGDNQLIYTLRKEMESIQSIHHSNVVRIYGACLNPPNVCLIEDLSSNYINLSAYFQSDWNYLQVLRISHVMAQALEALHRKMPHGDIRLQSFIIKLPGSVKITNYIKAARIPRLFKQYDGGECVAYMAPEVIPTAVISRPADIYSFGVMLWEMMSGKKPWGQYDTTQQLKQALDEGQKLIFDDNWPDNFVQILNKCLHRDPLQRPTANQLMCLLYTELCTYVDPQDPENSQPVAQFL